jgi:hypothetical protein
MGRSLRDKPKGDGRIMLDFPKQVIPLFATSLRESTSHRFRDGDNASFPILGVK